MKKLIILLLLLFFVSACVRPAGTPTPTQEPTSPLATFFEAPTAIVIQPTHTLPGDSGGSEATAAPTEPAATLEPGHPTPFTIKPTDTPTSTPEGTESPETTEEPATTSEPTSTPEDWDPPEYPPFDPVLNFGGSRHIEDFQDETVWQNYFGDMENDYIALVIEKGQMQVTGKHSYFRTPWFGGFELGDFYIEMDVNSGDCTFDDSYGVIVRGEPSDHGYAIVFNCGGEIAAWRIDSIIDPYIEYQILGWTPTDLIRTGANQPNLLGVRMEGNEITIYANRYEFTTLYDDSYDWGQYGVFVMAGENDNYTYTIDQIQIWQIEED